MRLSLPVQRKRAYLCQVLGYVLALLSVQALLSVLALLSLSLGQPVLTRALRSLVAAQTRSR